MPCTNLKITKIPPPPQIKYKTKIKTKPIKQRGEKIQTKHGKIPEMCMYLFCFFLLASISIVYYSTDEYLIYAYLAYK